MDPVECVYRERRRTVMKRTLMSTATNMEMIAAMP